jgi:hypothetical protein
MTELTGFKERTSTLWVGDGQPFFPARRLTFDQQVTGSVSAGALLWALSEKSDSCLFNINQSRTFTVATARATVSDITESKEELPRVLGGHRPVDFPPKASARRMY